MKIVGDKQEIVNKNYNKLVKMNQNITVQADVNTKYDSNETILVGGDHQETIKGDVTQIYNSTLNTKVKGKVTEKYEAGQTIDGGPNMTIKAGIINLN
jgi:hypothetical protein